MPGKTALPTIRSLLAAGCVIQGDLRFREGLRIDGAVHGDVRAEPGEPSLLVISESGSVEGEVAADHVIVNGRIRGPVLARDRLELQPGARIDGDVHYLHVMAYPGAVIAGRMQPLGAEAEKPLLSLASSRVEALEGPGLA